MFFGVRSRLDCTTRSSSCNLNTHQHQPEVSLLNWKNFSTIWNSKANQQFSHTLTFLSSQKTCYCDMSCGAFYQWRKRAGKSWKHIQQCKKKTRHAYASNLVPSAEAADALPGLIRGWGICDFFPVSTKASIPISLSPFLSFSPSHKLSLRRRPGLTLKIVLLRICPTQILTV